MKVTLRQRNQGKKTSLYLDYYENGKRIKKSLKLYLHPSPKTKQEKQHNKETEALAIEIATKENIKIQAEQWGIRDLEKGQLKVLEFLELIRDEKKKNTNTYGNWNSMINCFKNYQKSGLTFNQLDRATVQSFKDHLDKLGIAQNTKYSYFAKFKAGMKSAVEREIITKNPAQFVKHFSQEETHCKTCQ